MYLDNIDDLIPYIENNPDCNIVVVKAHDCEILIQSLVRNINGKDITFFTLRNMCIPENMRHKGFFKNVVNTMISTDRNIMFHDVVNDYLKDYFTKMEYTHFIDVKNYHKLDCWYIEK